MGNFQNINDTEKGKAESFTKHPKLFDLQELKLQKTVKALNVCCFYLKMEIIDLVKSYIIPFVPKMKFYT